MTRQGSLIQAAQKLVNKLQSHISAEEWVKIINCSSIENMASITSKGNLLIEALQEFSNLTEGIVHAQNVRIGAGGYQE